MSKFIGFIVGTALVVVGVLTGNPALIIQGVELIAAQAVYDLTMAHQPARQASEMTLALGEQPRVMLVGETYTPGSLVDGWDWGGKYGTDWEGLLIRLADEPCEGLTGFYVDDTYVPYTGNGNYPQFDSHHFQLYFRADCTNEALDSFVTDNWPGWESSDVGKSGCDVFVAYLADAPDAKKPAWPGGRPRFGFVLKGGKRYDPRKDSTVTGGSGSHRWDDPTTWEWTENAVINWYNFERGVYVDGDTSDQSKLLVGRGLTAEESPPENIFAAANLCDDVAASVFPVELLAGGITLQDATFSPDLTKLIAGAGTALQVWYLPTRTLLSSVTPEHNLNGLLAVDSDGTIYVGETGSGATGVATVDPYSGAVTELSSDHLVGVWIVAAGIWGGPTGFVSNKIAQLVGDTVVQTSVGFHANQYFDTAAGDSYAFGGVGDGSGGYTNGAGFCQLPSGTPVISSTGLSGDAYAVENPSGLFFTWQADNVMLIDPSDGSITAGPVSGATFSGNGPFSFRAARPGDSSIWIGFTKYSTVDLSVIETVNPSDWPTGGASNDDPMFAPVLDAMLTRGTLESDITVRFLDRHGGYRVAGPIYSNQEHIDVEQMFAAAVGGNIVTHEGQVLLEPGQAKSATFSFTDDDLLVGSKVSWNQGFLSQAASDWLNTVVGNYIEPDQKWNPHNTPPLRDTADITADGKPREVQLTLRLVRYAAQAMRVCEYARRLGRLWGRATVTLGPRFCEIEEGDWGTWQSDRYFGGATKTFRVDAYSIDEKWQNTLTLREISAEVYADDATFPTDQSVATTTPPPPDIGTPDAGNWALAAVTLDSAGASVPALHFAGDTSDDGYVEAVITEYWADDGVGDPTSDPDSVSWIVAGRDPPSSTFIKDVTSIIGGATYYGAVTYIVDGELGDRLVLGPVTVSDYTNPTFQEEDGVTEFTLEDDATLLTLEI